MPFIFKGMHKLWLWSSYIFFQCWYIHIPKYTIMFSLRSTTCHQNCSLKDNTNWVSLLESLCPLGPSSTCFRVCGSSTLIPAISYLSSPHLHHHAPGSPWPALVLGQGITPSLFKEGEMCLCLKSMHSARRSTSYLSCYLSFILGNWRGMI